MHTALSTPQATRATQAASQMHPQVAHVSAADLSINLDHDWERRNWMRWLGCTEEQLLHAVESVGNDCDNVRRFLRQAR